MGDLTVLADCASDTVIAAGFTSYASLWNRLAALSGDTNLVLRQIPEPGSIAGPIAAYFAGATDQLEQLKVHQPGTEFQHMVWDALRAIPAGQTRTYGELAQSIGRPKAVRAVGSACGRNLVAPIIPCHRALRSDGALGGYYYGLHIKQSLLTHESKR